MAEITKNNQLPSHWWWLDTHTTTTTRSPWLQSTLSELNEKTKAMLKVIEEDADSFAKRAEMYYKKRPELVNMVEDFYRTHRSLAERYDQVRPDTGIGLGLLTTAGGGSPFASAKHRFEKLTTSLSDRGYDTYSESFGLEDESVESEVDDPDPEEEEEEEEEVSFAGVNYGEVMKLRDEVKRLNEENKEHKNQLKMKDDDATCHDEAMMMLREEIERLREENEGMKEQLKQKDEEKIEVIRNLSLAIDLMKQENVKMRNFITREESTKKLKKSKFEFNKILGAFSGKLFNGPAKNEPGVELSRCGAGS